MQQVLAARQVLLGSAGESVPDGAVLVDGETITAVGPRFEIERQADVAAVHRYFPTSTILPGLINSHVHLVWDTSQAMLEHYRVSEDVELIPGMAGRAQQALAAGVTTLRDLGDRDGLVLRLRDAINRGDLAGPRILGSAAPLTLERGHCWFFGGGVRGEEEIRARVRRNAELGADVIKVMASGGKMTENSPPMWQSQFSSDEMRLIVEEATAAGLAVAAHAHGTDAIAMSVAAGVRTIEHCSWIRDGGGGYDERADIAKELAASGTYVCPAWPPRWREFMDRIGDERSRSVISRLQWMDELGVPLITGTDAGLPDSVFDGFVDALELYVHAGFCPSRVVEMATVNSAAALGIGEHVGTLASGYSADLLVAEGDPATDLDSLRRLNLVMNRGNAQIPGLFRSET